MLVSFEVFGQYFLPAFDWQILPDLCVQLQFFLVQIAHILMHLVLRQGSQYL